MFSAQERAYLESARVGRLATATAEGKPHAVPVCFAVDGEQLVTPIDEKPQTVSPPKLRRTRDIAENPRVAVVVDHYVEDWSRLGWVQIRGTAKSLEPREDGHSAAVSALRRKYEQYAAHELESRPVIRIDPGSVRSWGALDRPNDGSHSR